MFSYYFEDTEYEKSYIDHERETVRAVLHTQNDTYLFVKIQGQDLFGERNHIETVGGGVEPGEDLITALHREVLEETGYTVLSEQPLLEVTDFYNLIHRKTHSHFYLAEVDTRNGGDPCLTEQEKTLFSGIVELTAEEALKILQQPENPCSRLIYRRDILAFTEAERVIEARTRKMKQRKANGLGVLFLIEMVLSGLLVMLSLLDVLNGLPVILLLLLSEMPMIVPTIGYIIRRKLSFRDLGFSRIKAGTVFMTILASFLLWPIVGFVNILSQFFVPNVVLSISDSLFGSSATVPGWIMLLYMGVLAPCMEELGYRSLYVNQFRTVTKPIYAVLVSSLLFGLFHLNLNQLGYAAVIGIVMGFINIASGSVFTSCIIHIVFNSCNVLLLMALHAGPDVAAAAEAVETSGATSGMLVETAVFFGLIALAAFFPLRGCIRWIARHEGHAEDLAAIAVSESDRARIVFTIPMIAAIALGVFLC